MPKTKEYEVLRLIEVNHVCYVSADSVQGNSLAEWIRFHPRIEKGRLLQWMNCLTRQLILIYRCRSHPHYQYVNPYSIIVSADGKIYFLNIKSKMNEGNVRMMNGNNIRRQFLPGDELNWSDEEVNIYGLGRTLQYVLSFVMPEPSLTMREERILQKMIKKCVMRNSRGAFGSMQELYKFQQSTVYKGLHRVGI